MDTNLKHWKGFKVLNKELKNLNKDFANVTTMAAFISYCLLILIFHNDLSTAAVTGNYNDITNYKL